MANTYTLIASNTLGSSAASVTFSSIPNTYTDLVVRASLRSNATGSTTQTLYITVNTSTVYSATYMWDRMSFSDVRSGRFTNDTFWETILMNAVSSTSSTFTSLEMYLPNYASTTANKTGSIFAAAEGNTSTDSSIQRNVSALLSSNTAAINTITFQGGFLADSSFFLYGIKNS